VVNESKTLTVGVGGASLVWDGGTSVPIETGKTYALYDQYDNNFILVTIGGSLPTPAADYPVVIASAVLAGQITVIELEDELTAAILLTDASAATVTADGTYPRPASTHYAVCDEVACNNDKSLVAINNGAGTTDISVNYSVYNDPRAYTSQNAVETDHLAGTEIAKTSAKMFANGAGTVSVINVNDGSAAQYALGLTMLHLFYALHTQLHTAR